MIALARDGAAALRWTAPTDTGGAPILDYVIERADDGGFYPLATTTGTTYYVHGLTNGVNTWFRVAARNAAGTGPFVTAGTNPSPPSAPVVTRLESRARALFVRWGWAGESPLGYRVERRAVGSSSWVHVTTTSVLGHQFMIQSLSNGLAYDVRIGAVYEQGILYSSATRATPGLPPAAPGGLTLIAGPGRARAVWGYSPDNGGAVIAGYQLQLSHNGSNWSSCTTCHIDAATPTSIATTVRWAEFDATPGQRLFARVAAVTAVGVGAYSASVSIPIFDYPDEPGSFDVFPGARSTFVSWGRPASTGFAPIRNYQVQVKPVGAASWNTVATTAALSFNITGLVNGGRYCVRVVAWNTAGLGSATYRLRFTAGTWSGYDPYGVGCYTEPSAPSGSAPSGSSTQDPTSSALDADAAPDEPSIAAVADQPNFEGYVTYGDGTILLRIGAPAEDGGSPVTSYIVERAENRAGPLVWARTTVTTTTPVLTGYLNGRSYVVRIAAVNADGQSAFSTPGFVEPRALWTPNVWQAVPGDRSATVSWSPSDAYPGDPTATGFRILKRVGSGGWTLVADVAGTVSSYRVTGLGNGAATDILVRAYFANGAITQSTIRTTAFTVPSAPVGLRVVAGGGYVDLAWGYARSNGGSPITDYAYQTSLDGVHWIESDGYNAVWPGTPIQAYSRTSFARYARTDVYPGQRIWVRVAAFNRAGHGPWSSVVSTTALSFAGHPRNLRVTPQSGSARLRWNPPSSTGGASLDEYEVEIHPVGSSYWYSAGTTTSSDVIITGLTNGARYCVRVWAWTYGGLGYPTTPIVFTAGSSSGYDATGLSCR